MKESKTNQESSGRTGTPDGKPFGSSPQRDPWTMLQSQLGLLSSPIEQEQVSVVPAVDHQESDDAQHHGTSAEVLENEVPSVHQESDSVVVRSTDSVVVRSTDSVAVNILVPEAMEKESDPFGFDAIDDCDIPQNAFASGKKSRSFRRVAGRTAPFTESPADVPPQDTPEVQDFAHPPEVEQGQSETMIDPLLSDELPTSLWQPRKPASVAKTPVPTAAPSSFSNSLNKAEVDRVAGRTVPHDAAPPHADDLDRPSSGKKRYERGGGRQEKSLDRRSREPMQDAPDRDRCEHRNAPDNPKHRQPGAAASQSAFDDFTFDDPVAHQIDPLFNELAWEPKPASKGRDRKPGRSSRHADIPAMTERGDKPSTHWERGRDDNDWLDDGVDMEMEQASPRSKQNCQRPSYPEKSEKPEKREKFDKNARVAYEAERILARRAREEHVREERGESPPRPSAASNRPEMPAKSPTSDAPPQKIAVSSWDDAVRDIIEKNMQRRPATSGNKNDRDRRSGGRGHRR